MIVRWSLVLSRQAPWKIEEGVADREGDQHGSEAVGEDRPTVHTGESFRTQYNTPHQDRTCQGACARRGSLDHGPKTRREWSGGQSLSPCRRSGVSCWSPLGRRRADLVWDWSTSCQGHELGACLRGRRCEGRQHRSAVGIRMPREDSRRRGATGARIRLRRRADKRERQAAQLGRRRNDRNGRPGRASLRREKPDGPVP